MAVALRRSFSSPLPADPVPEMNITPLIDVLLVLTVMMILTIPIMTHEVPIDLPVAGKPRHVAPVETHRIAIDAAGALRWDGRLTSETDLPARLATIATDPDAVLEIESDARARYETFDRTLAIIKRAGVNRLGFVGNQAFADFSAGPKG